jgi:hypothetical protein
MRVRRLLWLGPVALLVLAARWLTYALAPPSLLANRLEGTAGGPRLVVITVVSLSLAAAVSTAAVWLAAVGVRERQRLRPERELPRIRLQRLVLRAVALAVASSLAFALVESYVHWRAGLGFHGLSCLFGPVHRNALPVLSALSLVIAALAEAVQHLRAWAGAAVRALLARPLALAEPRQACPALRRNLSSAAVVLGARPRAPPVPA